jgi:hypothetical protein
MVFAYNDRLLACSIPLGRVFSRMNLPFCDSVFATKGYVAQRWVRSTKMRLCLRKRTYASVDLCLCLGPWAGLRSKNLFVPLSLLPTVANLGLRPDL